MNRLNDFSTIDTAAVVKAAEEFGTPLYVYDEGLILEQCKKCLDMPNAFGITVRYAMKANSNRTLLKIISGAGLQIDASSLNEVIRANLAGVPFADIMLTTQEIHVGSAREKLEELMLLGMKYTVCSLRQLRLIGDFAAANGITPAIRIHPGVGSGESATRNTGDDYSCFGIHLSDISEANEYAGEKGIVFRHIHEHIGSGGDPELWRQNIDVELGIIEKHFPEAETVCFGGGLKEARTPDERAADLTLLGNYAKERIGDFYKKTGRKLKTEIEPGTYILANSGYAVTRVIDKKSTAKANFIIADGGMEINSRPLLYGSRHPIYIISAGDGRLKSSEFSTDGGSCYKAVVAGKCCESGDCQTLDTDGRTVARAMAEPDTGDIAVIGGAGAYCSSMAPFNYNSHTQAPEVLYTKDGQLRLIRKRQTLEQMLENEI